ncbi:MAG: BMP family ABC transporter substrate-binding protein [Chloroflexi bacterium]|nr:BMP family ABC transporter substrate-binding protein [Chloroflexota bacterium]MBI3338780.1 BMP family ABC transporter substrate-binding protein [Chloroflexota bacterium]
MRKTILQFALLAVAFAMVLSACGTAPTAAPVASEAPAVTQAPVVTEAPTVAPTAAPFTFGILLVGPYNDQGWSQATYEGAQYAEKQLGGKLVYIDKVNPADRPGTTASQLAEQLVNQGAKLVIFNSDDMKDEALKFAQANPDIYVIGASLDWTWKDGKNYKESPNQTDIMGRMEYGKMIAGCAAALTTQTGKIGYLGPLINDETRRLASSAYLGAKYCWTNYLGKNAADLKFKVTWIGFWFNIPGVTSDPTQVADEFFNSGYDVVLSGIDTTEASKEAAKSAASGKKAWAIPYDYVGSCEAAPDVCLGVPYFNWGPAFAATIKTASDGTWKSNFQWNAPDWKDINNKDTSAVGFVKGKALSADAGANVDKFIAELAGGLNLWTGPINLQDGTAYLKDGEVGTDLQVWYLPQLLKGMEGQSVSQ